MLRFCGSIAIACPVSDVFAYVSDWRNPPRFLKALKRFEPVDPENAYGLGSRFAATVAVGPVNVDGEMEVIEFVPNERVVFHTRRGPKMRGTWDFRTEDGHTVVDLTNDFDSLPGGLVGRVVRTFIDQQAQHELDASLEELKRRLESGDL
ncbi:MAG TPA: SRPBCC family protein [Actinomycetota bacterium]|nr:SRPBCC family protein [Actinomycetota bacterium]